MLSLYTFGCKFSPLYKSLHCGKVAAAKNNLSIILSLAIESCHKTFRAIGNWRFEGASVSPEPESVELQRKGSRVRSNLKMIDNYFNVTDYCFTAAVTQIVCIWSTTVTETLIFHQESSRYRIILSIAWEFQVNQVQCSENNHSPNARRMLPMRERKKWTEKSFETSMHKMSHEHSITRFTKP